MFNISLNDFKQYLNSKIKEIDREVLDIVYNCESNRDFSEPEKDIMYSAKKRKEEINKTIKQINEFEQIENSKSLRSYI